MRSEAQTRRASRLVEDRVDGAEEYIAEDVEADAGIGLNATEALAAARRERSVGNFRAWDSESLAADGYVEVWGAAAAGEDVATLVVVVAGTGDLGVVGLDYGRWEVEERSASVGNGGTDAAGGGIVSADGVAACSELPEALRLVDRNVGDRASVLRAVDVAMKKSAAECIDHRWC